ncbi:hypothetical protein SBF1_920004 [Candidatus Desulfosporosinus infrequens]|uniref:Uncharacterized protein n=1 Tax=Candidatus Desulfosporosinus infrequens TaxID=2043169 RepID=A0A2U3LX42_9FIRM|nr:hypothetical protein SBF1_920004 [Candidatus Desulfosporosinus infrequens]
MNQFYKDFKISILRVCEKIESLAEIGIQNDIAKSSDFFPYIPNFRHEIIGITTDEGFKSYYGNWGVKELDSLIKQVCGKICVCGCEYGAFPVAEHECDMCPISCYRETYGLDEDVFYL